MSLETAVEIVATGLLLVASSCFLLVVELFLFLLSAFDLKNSLSSCPSSALKYSCSFILFKHTGVDSSTRVSPPANRHGHRPPILIDVSQELASLRTPNARIALFFLSFLFGKDYPNFPLFRHRIVVVSRGEPSSIVIIMIRKGMAFNLMLDDGVVEMERAPRALVSFVSCDLFSVGAYFADFARRERKEGDVGRRRTMVVLNKRLLLIGSHGSCTAVSTSRET